MTITQFEVFVTVVETGSFTKAGEKLNMTQSAVSHAIKGLENEIGVTLLIRNRRHGLLLSDIGKRVLVHAREILNRIRHIKQETSTTSAINSGSLKVGSFSSASLHLLPKMISIFHTQYPNVDITLFDGTYQEVSEWVSSRIVDIGFATMRQPELEFVPLLEYKMVVVLPESHSLLSKDVIQIADLANEPLILTKAGSEKLVWKMFKDANLHPNIRFKVQDGGTIMNMVKENLGVTIGPELAIPKKQAGIEMRTVNPLMWRQIGLTCPSIEEASPAVRAFIDLACQLYHLE